MGNLICKNQISIQPDRMRIRYPVIQYAFGSESDIRSQSDIRSLSKSLMMRYLFVQSASIRSKWTSSCTLKRMDADQITVDPLAGQIDHLYHESDFPSSNSPIRE